MSAAEREAARARYAKAEAMFQERCKKAGEFIHRTAENVEGVFLLKLRPSGINYRDQYRMDDPYGHDSTGDEYIKSFLYGRNEKGSLVIKGMVASKGYRYIEAIDPQDGKRYRYTGGMKAVGKKDTTAYNIKLAISKDPNYDLNIYRFVLDRVPAPGPAPRYGVTYNDISTREERDYWIAGSSLRVIDLKTNEVMAERIGYMMDHGQGNDSGGRSPWLFAAYWACPRFSVDPGGHVYQTDQTRKFVEKTLKPFQEH
jgi:hypothetical protein